jgi:ABC-type Fe3+ transport system substrate-binding protein/tRNA A-37 threonylcarbamoyl transferase component Bud32
MDPLIGKIVGGRYQVIRLIAHGGMGDVYELRHQRVNRTFALKTLARELLNNPQSLQRFRREADVVASFRHPNIVEIVDWETLDDGSPCIVMEYLRGEDLGSLIARQGPMPWRQIAILADQALSALTVAHRAGIVHRDLKPQNIFVVYDDAGELHAKLLDFGVSKIRDGGSMPTAGHELIGTPAYMSPEQAQAKAAELGPSTDVWAMGAILSEMATARVAFDAPNMPAILYRVTHGEPEPLRAFRPDTPPAFEQLVNQTLARDPAMRLDAHALRMALRQALASYAGDAFHATPMPVSVPSRASSSPHASTMTGAAAQLVGQPGKSSHRGLWIALLAIALVIGGITTFALFAGGGAAAKSAIEVQVVYSSEKKEWMEATTAAFEKQHPDIAIKLDKMGSLEAGEAILAGKSRPVLWSPADTVVLDLFAADWRAAHGSDLLARGDDAPQRLLLTPIVWISWEDRAATSWHAIHDAIGKDHLKLGHTDPTRSSTGLLALLSMASEYSNRLDEAAIADPAFVKWLGEIEGGVAKKDEASTGSFSKTMIELGASQVEVGVVYESIAIAMFDKAKQRWGKALHVEYPAVTFWSDHPIALLAGDWVKPDQAKAAHAFVAFLRSREAQQSALQYGFRAAEVDIPLMTEDPANPFKKYAGNGIKLDIPAARGVPPTPVVKALLAQWRKLAGR